MNYTRREWLQALLASGVTMALPVEGLLRAQSRPRQKFRVGYQLLSWGRYYPVDWWEGCHALAELSFPGVEGESTIARLYEGRFEEFEGRMQQLGLGLAALYSTSDLEKEVESYQNFNRNLRAAEFLRRMGARVLVVGGTETPNPTPDDYRRLADTANELGRKTWEQYEIKIAFHPHRGNLIQHREDIGRLMEFTDPRYVFLAPDTGHLLAGGSDPVEVFRTYGDRIAHTHFKDFDPDAPGWGGRRGRMTLLGQGKVNFPSLVEILQEHNFNGWIVIEFDSRSDPRETAAANRRYVREELRLKIE